MAGELVVEARLEQIEAAARRIIGRRMRVVEKEGGVVVFAEDTETCPLEIKATPIGEGAYRLDVSSRCTTRNCDYFAECARLDARAARRLRSILAEELGSPDLVREVRWHPERLADKEKLRRVVDRVVDTG